MGDNAISRVERFVACFDKFSADHHICGAALTLADLRELLALARSNDDICAAELLREAVEDHDAHEGESRDLMHWSFRAHVVLDPLSPDLESP